MQVHEQLEESAKFNLTYRRRLNRLSQMYKKRVLTYILLITSLSAIRTIIKTKQTYMADIWMITVYLTVELGIKFCRLLSLFPRLIEKVPLFLCSRLENNLVYLWIQPRVQYWVDFAKEVNELLLRKYAIEA